MPKMKSHSGAKKRFKATSGGTKIKRASQNKNHILNKKSRERKRKLRQGDYVASGQDRMIRALIGKGGKSN
ncbi:MAG: 50S ribosomal protein L35 [Firmicutes bacterium]|nr:50S ribosomal protein L35 [Bacillota bacterium]